MSTKNFGDFVVSDKVQQVKAANTVQQIEVLKQLKASNRAKVFAAMAAIAKDHGVEFDPSTCMLDWGEQIGVQFKLQGKVVFQGKIFTYGTSPLSYFVSPVPAPKSRNFETIIANVDGVKTGDVTIVWDEKGKGTPSILNVVNKSHSGQAVNL